MRLRVLSTILLSSMLCMLALSIDSYAQANSAVCHLEGNGSFHLIVVANRAVYNAHLKHGDVLPENGLCPATPGGGGDGEPGAVPEPLTILLLGTGLAGIGYVTRRCRNKGNTYDGEQI